MCAVFLKSCTTLVIDVGQQEEEQYLLSFYLGGVWRIALSSALHVKALFQKLMCNIALF